MIRVLSHIEGGKCSDWGGAAHMGYAAWTNRTNLAYQLSKNPQKCQEVYELHLGWVVKQLKSHRVKVNAHNVGVVWRRGLTKALEIHFQDEYGTRCQNLMNDPTFK